MQLRRVIFFNKNNIIGKTNRTPKIAAYVPIEKNGMIEKHSRKSLYCPFEIERR